MELAATHVYRLTLCENNIDADNMVTVSQQEPLVCLLDDGWWIGCCSAEKEEVVRYLNLLPLYHNHKIPTTSSIHLGFVKPEFGICCLIVGKSLIFGRLTCHFCTSITKLTTIEGRR